MLIGHQLAFFLRRYTARRRPVDAGGDAEDRLRLAGEWAKVVMQVVVSLVVLVLGGWLLRGGVDAELHKVGAGLIGTVLGYWLR